MKNKNILRWFVGINMIFVTAFSCADSDLISLFPLENYNQTISAWIKPTDADFNNVLMPTSVQQKHLALFYARNFGDTSPWDVNYVNQILKQEAPNNVKTIEESVIRDFNNEGKPSDQIGYGENFRPYTKEWIEDIAKNISLSQFDNLTYQTNNRGIAVDNLSARVLPTDDVHFYNYKLAGQGYPFDNLQMSALWAGTPVYIVAESEDHAWMLVITPDYISWVKSSGIARADNAFISKWTAAAKNKLAAITHTQTGMVDEKGNFLFSAYVGSVFPISSTAENLQLMAPSMDADHHAIIKNVNVASSDAAQMPLTATPHHFAEVMKTLIGRPYGWGSMYFYNDCSAELKSLLTPFGIWLPRHSSEQVKIGRMDDMTALSPDKRLSYLKENGERFLTLIYIGGHVILYVGNFPTPTSAPTPTQPPTLMAMTYQNLWGLSPSPAIRRAVVGKSVLFPMLLQYPEDTTLVSLAGKKYFQVSYLNQLSNINFLKNKTIDIKSLMYADP